jgi:hypothetical protein
VANSEAMNSEAVKPEVVNFEAANSTIDHLQSLGIHPANHIRADCICLAEDILRKASAAIQIVSVEAMRRKASVAGISKPRISVERALVVAIRTAAVDTPAATVVANITAKKRETDASLLA